MSTLDDEAKLESNVPRSAVAEPLLYDGQRLDLRTFHKLYSRMPEDFHAELVDGVVFLMNMPLYSDHAEPDSNMIGILFTYSIETPGTTVRNNVTTRFAPDSEVQPDSCLLIQPEYGGQSGKDEQGATIDAPELIVEIADSTLQLDLYSKKLVYEKAGAREYLVFDVPNRKFHWFALADGRFEPLGIGPDGVFRSRAFPGLWLDEAAFVQSDFLAVVATLRRGLESPEHTDFVERLRQNRANRP
jgi:Uma2 family endonuclease